MDFWCYLLSSVRIYYAYIDQFYQLFFKFKKMQSSSKVEAKHGRAAILLADYRDETKSLFYHRVVKFLIGSNAKRDYWRDESVYTAKYIL